MRVRDRQDSFCPLRQARLTCWGQQHTAGGATYHGGARGRTGNPATVAGNSFVCRASFPEDGRGWMCGDRRGRQAGIWGRRPAESLWVRVGGRMPRGAGAREVAARGQAGAGWGAARSGAARREWVSPVIFGVGWG